MKCLFFTSETRLAEIGELPEYPAHTRDELQIGHLAKSYSVYIFMN